MAIADPAGASIEGAQHFPGLRPSQTIQMEEVRLASPHWAVRVAIDDHLSVVRLGIVNRHGQRSRCRLHQVRRDDDYKFRLVALGSPMLVPHLPGHTETTDKPFAAAN